MRFHRHSKINNKKKVVQSPKWLFKLLCSALWSNRSFIFHAITLFSIAGNVVTLAGSLDVDWWQAISDFNSNAQASLHQIIDLIHVLSQRPVLYLLINLILFPIVAKSGALGSTSHNNSNTSDHHHHHYYSLGNHCDFVLDCQENSNISDYHNIISLIEDPNQELITYNHTPPSFFTIQNTCETTHVQSPHQTTSNIPLHISPCSISSSTKETLITPSSVVDLGTSIASMEVGEIASLKRKEDIINSYRSSSFHTKQGVSMENIHPTIFEPLYIESTQALGHDLSQNGREEAMATLHLSSLKPSSSSKEEKTTNYSHYISPSFEAQAHLPSKNSKHESNCMDSKHLEVQHTVTPPSKSLLVSTPSKQHHNQQRVLSPEEQGCSSLDMSSEVSNEGKPHKQEELSIMLDKPTQQSIVSTNKEPCLSTKSSKPLTSCKDNHKRVYYMDDIVTRQEFNERVENFIFKFKRNLTMQRQDSLNRLLSLIGTSEIRITR